MAFIAIVNPVLPQLRNERLSLLFLCYIGLRNGEWRDAREARSARLVLWLEEFPAYRAGADSDPPAVNKIPKAWIWTAPASLPRPEDRSRFLLLELNPWQGEDSTSISTSRRAIYLPPQTQFPS